MLYPTFEDVTEADKIRTARDEYRRYGLHIFESFEEYMQEQEEQEND